MGDFSSNNEPSLLVANRSHSSAHTDIVSASPSAMTDDRQSSADVKKQIKDSVNYNAALAGVSLMKVLTSAFTLATSTSQSTSQSNDFVTYMVLHDVIYIFSLVLKIFTIVNSRCSLIPKHSNNAYNIPQPNEPTSFQLPMGDNVIAISSEAEKKNSVNFALATTTKTVYYLLFLYAHVLYFYPSWICSESNNISDPAGRLVFFYMICGYIYVGMPVIFAVGLSVCLPCIMLFTYFFSVGDQVPTNKEFINNLPVIKYCEPLPGENECRICVMDYQKGEKVVQLPCSHLHHFHEGCLKKWLEINGVCPVCRKRINEEEQVPEEFMLQNGDHQ